MNNVGCFRYFFLILFLIASQFSLEAQDIDSRFMKPYSEALGFKAGNIIQVDYKLFINQELAINIGAGAYWVDLNGLYFSAVLTDHTKSKYSNLFFYYGAGIASRIANVNVSKSQLGMAMALGIEAFTKKKSFTFFADIQPTVYSNRNSTITPTGGGFGSFSVSNSIDLDINISPAVGVRYIFR